MQNLHSIDPMRINLICADLDVRTEMSRMEGDVVDGDWDTPLPTTFEQLDTFEALRDRLIRGKPWQDTPFYKRTVRSIESGTPKWGCTSEGAFLRRLSTEVEPLYDEIREHGYKTQAALGSEKPEVQVGIRRDGRFIFMDGKHRLSIARLLQLPQIPVQVVVRHTEWEAFKDELREEARTGLRGRIYQAIDHPDLVDIPAHKGWDRVSILAGALADYDCEGKRLLDIGCQWAFMSQQMEKLGFRCQGIESNAKNVYFAQKIGIATESKFEVWHGNLVDFPQPEANVVLALNIFHHLLKTEQRHTGLIDFLHRLSAEIILFEPHLPERAFRQMEGAYRDYEPQEFAEFVAEHAGMSTIEHLGAADDERPLYKLSA
jgi:2-polyprenyl-3-methyl-5-hydroxy-6-metoxy-1,4-benzoquinol methylase